jgi:outer membrane protein assembly factor BamE
MSIATQSVSTQSVASKKEMNTQVAAKSDNTGAVRFLLLVIPFFLSACFLVPHKIDVQQGNFVDQEMMSKLQLDMTRSQVLFVLGTPLVTDVFHPDRWDYVYLTGKAGDVDRRRGITVVFSENRLIRIEGDVALLRAAPALQVDASNQ